MTDRFFSQPTSLLAKIYRTLQATICIAVGGVAATAGLTVLQGSAPAALVVLPDQALFDELPHDIEIVQWRRYSAVMTSNSPDYVRRLYKAGALLVLPTWK